MDEHKFQTGQSDETPSHDCSDCCSPFMPCSACPGFTVETFTWPQSIPQRKFAEINCYRTQIYTSPLLCGIWQPPEFV
jgi:hypothetical protein